MQTGKCHLKKKSAKLYMLRRITESNFKAEEPENKHSAAIVRYVISAPEKNDISPKISTSGKDNINTTFERIGRKEQC